MKNNRENNKEKIKQKQETIRENNKNNRTEESKEKEKQRQKAYWETNPDKIKMGEQKINCLRPVCAATFSNDNSNIGRKERRACALKHEIHLKKIYSYERKKEGEEMQPWLGVRIKRELDRKYGKDHGILFEWGHDDCEPEFWDNDRCPWKLMVNPRRATKANFKGQGNMTTSTVFCPFVQQNSAMIKTTLAEKIEELTS